MAENAKILIRAVDDTKRAFSSIQASFRSLGSQIDVVKGALAGLAGAFVVRDLFDAAVQYQKMQKSLEFAAGGAAAGAKEFAYLNSEANRLGLNLVSAGQAFASFAAAAKGTSLEGEGARKTFTAISEAATVLGLSADNTQGALYALSQMVSKGKVQAEELRGQLGERLPGAFQIAARAMGVSTSELDKMLEQGQVLSDEFLPRFAQELHKTFAGSLPTAVNSAQASLNRFQTEVFRLKVAFAESGFLEVATEALKSLTTVLKDPQTMQAVRQLGSGLKDLVRDVRQFVSDYGELIKQLLIGLAIWKTWGVVLGALAPALASISKAMRAGATAAQALGLAAGFAGKALKTIVPIAALTALTELVIKLRSAYTEARRFQQLSNQLGSGQLDDGGLKALQGQLQRRITDLQKKIGQGMVLVRGEVVFNPSEAKKDLIKLQAQLAEVNRQLAAKAKSNPAAAPDLTPDFSAELPKPKLGGGTGKPKKTPAAILNDAKQTLDAHLALTKDSLDRESRLIEQQLADHLLSYRDYYAKKQALEQAAIDAELAAKRAERASSKDRGDVARLTAEITILERKRGDVAVQSRRDQIQAEEALAQQLAGIRQQLLSDQGDVAGAAVEQIQAKYAELWDRLSAEGDTQGQALIQKAINVELAKAQLDALQQQYTLTMQRMQDADQRIQIARDTGLLSETQARQQVLDLHRATASELDQLIPRMEALATAAGNPQAVANVAALKTELLGLKTVANETGQAIESAVSGGMTNLFTDIMSGSKSAKDAFMDFANGVIQAIQRIVAQKLVEKLLDSTGGGGWVSAIGSVFGGARATGGPVQSGKTYLVGERGPELFSAGVSGYITPNNKLGGSQTIVNNFTVQGPTTRQTEMQIAAAAGAGVSRALRRNG